MLLSRLTNNLSLLEWTSKVIQRSCTLATHSISAFYVDNAPVRRGLCRQKQTAIRAQSTSLLDELCINTRGIVTNWLINHLSREAQLDFRCTPWSLFTSFSRSYCWLWKQWVFYWLVEWRWYRTLVDRATNEQESSFCFIGSTDSRASDCDGDMRCTKLFTFKAS